MFVYFDHMQHSYDLIVSYISNACILIIISIHSLLYVYDALNNMILQQCYSIYRYSMFMSQTHANVCLSLDSLKKANQVFSFVEFIFFLRLFQAPPGTEIFQEERAPASQPSRPQKFFRAHGKSFQSASSSLQLHLSFARNK